MLALELYHQELVCGLDIGVGFFADGLDLLCSMEPSVNEQVQSQTSTTVLQTAQGSAMRETVVP